MSMVDKVKMWWKNASTKERVLAVVGGAAVVLVILANIF